MRPVKAKCRVDVVVLYSFPYSSSSSISFLATAAAVLDTRTCKQDSCRMILREQQQQREQSSFLPLFPVLLPLTAYIDFIDILYIYIHLTSGKRYEERRSRRRTGVPPVHQGRYTPRHCCVLIRRENNNNNTTPLSTIPSPSS